MGSGIDRRVGAAGQVLHVLPCTVVTKTEMSRKAKLSIYWSIFVPTSSMDMSDGSRPKERDRGYKWLKGFSPQCGWGLTQR